MTAPFETAYLAPKLSGGIVASSTYTPLPWRDSTRPTDFMRETASLTTVRLTENSPASSASVATPCPPDPSPLSGSLRTRHRPHAPRGGHWVLLRESGSGST